MSESLEASSAAATADEVPIARVELSSDYELVVARAAAASETLRALDVFLRPEYFALHAPEFPSAFYGIVRHRIAGTPYQVLHFTEVEAGHFRSPARGTFGGPQALGRALPIEIVQAAFEAFERVLAGLGARRLTVVLPPTAHRATETAIAAGLLLHGGFTVSEHELNYAITIAGEFSARIDHGNRKRIAQAQRRELSFAELPPERLGQAYTVVADNRAKKGNTLSMTLAALERMSAALPGVVRAFMVEEAGAPLAAAICVAISARTLYVFDWGEVQGAEGVSPVTFLASELYAYCAREGFDTLDLGTSTLRGAPNAGLVRYKRNLGAAESLKLTLSKSLEPHA